MLKESVPTILSRLDELLVNKILETDLIYLDYWSIAHFSVGYLLYAKFKLKPIYAISLIILYELIEPAFTFFMPEKQIDTIWDIIIGIAGYYTARKYSK